MLISPMSSGDFSRPARAAAVPVGGEPRESFQTGRPAAPPRPDVAVSPRQAERERAYADLGRPEPEAALAWLSAGDPQVRRLARRKWGESLKSQLDKYVASYGPVDGAAAQIRLKSMFVSKSYKVDRSELEPALALVDQAVRQQGKASETPLKALLFMARQMHGRSQDASIEAEARQEARELSDRAGDLLSDWWRDGLCEVAGRAPGSLPLGQLAARETLAVRGNRLEQSHPPGGEAERIVTMNQPSVLVTMLAQNEASGRQLAGQLVQEVLARANERRAISVLSGLLDGCKDNPALREAFRPHLESLRSLTREASARLALGPDSVGTVAEEALEFYRNLRTAFPEVTDARLVQQLEPLFLDTHGAAADGVSYLLQAAWKERPELVGPSAQMVLRHDPSSAGWRLLRSAGEAGWRPDPHERDWMVNWLNGPADASPDRLALWNSGHFEPGLSALASFVSRDPTFHHGLTMADRHGQLKPVPDALADHLLQTSGSEKRFLSNRESWIQDLFSVMTPVPDPALEARLLEPIESDLGGCRELSGLSPEQRTRLAVLGSLQLSPEMHARLDRLLESALPRDQGDLEPVVDRFRAAHVKDHWQAFRAAENLSDRLEAARGALALTTGHSHNGYRYAEMTREALDGLSPEAAGELEQHLAHRVAVMAAQGKRLHELDPGPLSEVVLATTLERPSMLDALRALLPPEGADLVPGAERSANGIRYQLITRNDSLLAEPGHSEEQRLAWLEDCHQLAAGFSWEEAPESSLKAWSEHATGWAAATSQSMPLAEAYRSARVLVKEEDPTGLLYEVQGRLKAGDLFASSEEKLAPDAVANALESYRALRDQGLDRSQALDQVLGRVENPSAPTSTGVQVGQGHVEVGGVRLRRRT